MNKWKILLIIFTLFFGLILRLYKFNSPVADWHSFRQVDTLSVTKNYLQNGIDLLHPTYHDLSSTQSGIDNPKGYRMVEFPIYNLFSIATLTISNLNIDLASRLTSIILSIGTATLIFLWIFSITRTFAPAYLSCLFFLILPFNIYFNRTTLPENTAVFFMVFALYLFKINPIFAGISLGLSALIKPFTIILTGPIFLFLLYKSKSINRVFIIKVIFFAIFTIIPLLLWRNWITHYPQGIPASAWLLNFSDKPIFPQWYKGYNLDFLNSLLFIRPYWWRWLILERITILILGGIGIIPLFLGLIYKKNNINTINLLSLLSIFLYFAIVPGGNIQHDYYQILIIPFISIITGCGIYYLYNFTFDSKLLSLFSIIFILGLSIFLSAEKIMPNYKINHPEIITAGKKVDNITPKNAIVVAPYNGDTALLYQTNRSGFPIEVYDFEKIKKEFINTPIYFVSVNFDNYTNTIIKQFPITYRDSQFVVLQIQK